MKLLVLIAVLCTILHAQTGTTAAEQGITYEQSQAMHKTELRSVEGCFLYVEK